MNLPSVAPNQARATPAIGPARPPRIALVGVHGYGLRHLENLRRLTALGAVELVAIADPRPPADGSLSDGVEVFASLDELLAAGSAPDVAILATPIQTHAQLALTALAAGADVYLEKPPVASMAQYDAVLAAAARLGRLVQVGFQSLGSHALPAIDRLVPSGEIGEVRGISATGMWLRTAGYFKRSRWAGKRSLDGTDVVDGVATNALAHAVATGLRIAGARTVGDVASVETDLYRAHPTESDDTSVIRVRTAAGSILTCALTLCAAKQVAPSVTVYGTLGQAEFFYTEDRLEITTAAGSRSETYGRSDLLEDLLAARAARDSKEEAVPTANAIRTANADSTAKAVPTANAVLTANADSTAKAVPTANADSTAEADPGAASPELLSPLSATGAYTAVLEAIRTAQAPRPIGDAFVTWQGDGDDAHPVVHRIESLIRRAALAQATFAELGAPWATSNQAPSNQATSVQASSVQIPPALTLDGVPVAVVRDGTTVRPTSSPRPYLHPVRTLSGIVVTDHLPEDHVWHLGAGVAIQDVNGVNFWGGRTYTREAGSYAWRKDHGRIVLDSADTSPHESGSGGFQGGFRTEQLRWLAPDGDALLRERRTWAWAGVGPSAWRLTLDFTLESAAGEPVLLGSPGSNGRPQGGYGGFFWRLPAVAEVSIWTPHAQGEDAVHGSQAPWLAWAGNFGAAEFGAADLGAAQFGAGAPGTAGPATLVFHPAPQAPDPWFVRHSGYPGVGLSLAWDAPMAVEPSHPVHRTVTVVVADGLLTTTDIEQLINTLGETA